MNSGRERAREGSGDRFLQGVPPWVMCREGLGEENWQELCYTWVPSITGYSLSGVRSSGDLIKLKIGMRMKATLWGIVINIDVFNLSHIGKNVELKQTIINVWLPNWGKRVVEVGLIEEHRLCSNPKFQPYHLSLPIEKPGNATPKVYIDQMERWTIISHSGARRKVRNARPPWGINLVI